MIEKWFAQNKYSIFIVVLLLCFCGYSIVRSYGFTVFPDEFGYWTYAATLAGYDWSDIVSLGSYYSYGYSLILFPIFILCKNAVTAYRAAIMVNFILLLVCFFLLKKLTQKLFNKEKENTIALYTAIAVFYPSWLFYAKTTLAEIVIVTCYIAICALLYDYFEHNRKSTLILLSLMLVYIHFVHMRTIAVLIAGAMTLMGYYLMKKKKLKHAFAFLAIMLAAFLAGYWLKEWVTGSLYASSASVSVNDYAGQLGKLAYLFTGEGLRNFLISVSGKILYLGVASFGLCFWGIKHTVRQIYRAVITYRTEKRVDEKAWIYVFVLLSTLGAVLVSTVSTIMPGRVDSLTYGRYHEYVAPVLMLLGIKELAEVKKAIRDFTVIMITKGFMTGMITWSLWIYGQDNFHGYMMVGMSYLYKAEIFEPIAFFWKTWGMGIILMALVIIIVQFAGKHRNMEVIMITLVLLELALTLRASTLYLDDSARGAYRDTKIAERIEQLDRTGDREIYYCLHDNSYDLISILQFMLREKDIHVIETKDCFEKMVDENDLILLDYRDLQAKELEEHYDNYLENGHFILYYND